MESVYSNKPKQEHHLFVYEEVPGKYTTSLCVGITHEAHIYLRTDRYDDAGKHQTEYTLLPEHEVEDYIFQIRPDYKKGFDIPYSDREELFAIRNIICDMIDAVLIDRRSGCLYRRIYWAWSRGMCDKTICVPLSFDEAETLVPVSADMKAVHEKIAKYLKA